MVISGIGNAFLSILPPGVTGKTIDLRTKVDAAVLGGIRLDIEGTELDGTVKNRLASLRRSIAGITV